MSVDFGFAPGWMSTSSRTSRNSALSLGIDGGAWIEFRVLLLSGLTGQQDSNISTLHIHSPFSFVCFLTSSV